MRAKLLLVDDNKDLRGDFPVWFPEYDVTPAGSAEEALALLKKPNAFDLVLLDVYLPGMDGLAALEKIKELLPGKPVIIMTGYSTKDLAIHAISAKADNYLEKPFGVGDARALIEKELARVRGDAKPGEMGMEAKLAHVRAFVEANCFKKVTLKDAAAAVYLAPKYLSRVFRERTGEGFNDFKLKVKMAQARTLLDSTGLTVKQIAARLAYANPESFIRQFEKAEKQTPSCYRERKAGRARVRCRPPKRSRKKTV